MSTYTEPTILANDDPRRSPILRARCVDIVLAVILLVAAGLKGYQLLAHRGPIISSLIHSRWVIFALVQGEILLGIWLLVGGFARFRFVLSLLFFSMFAGAAFYEAAHALQSCGCFGNVKIPPLTTGGLDVLAVAALWLTRRGRTSAVNRSPPMKRQLFGVVAASLATVGLWVGYITKVHQATAESLATNSTNSDSDLVVLEPEKWVNQPFLLFDEIDGSAELRSGRWLVLFYHYDCDECLRAIPNYKHFARKEAGISAKRTRVAFVAMPPIAPANTDPVGISSDFLHLTLRTNHDWFATTPLLVKLNNGHVVDVVEGEKAIKPLD